MTRAQVLVEAGRLAAEGRPYALAHAGVRELEMPIGPDKVWKALVEAGLAE